MAGGSCSFDVPVYHHWLAQSAARMRRDMTRWCRHIEPIERAVALILGLLWGSARLLPRTAERGVHMHNTETDTQMIRVFVNCPVIYPEISAGRHRATVRVMQYHDAQLQVAQVFRRILSFR